MTAGARTQGGPVDRPSLRRARRTALAAVLLAAPVLFLGSPALAASTALGAGTVGGGTAAVTACGALDAVDVAYRTTSGSIVAVLVTGLPAGCDGGQLSLSLVTSGSAVTAGPLTVAGGAVTAELSSGPVSTAVTAVHLAVVR